MNELVGDVIEEEDERCSQRQPLSLGAEREGSLRSCWENGSPPRAGPA